MEIKAVCPNLSNRIFNLYIQLILYNYAVKSQKCGLKMLLL
nr:MAG TPA: hypothetical protein [Caudoviricetes sp.]